MNHAFTELEAHFKTISHFKHLGSICGWDQAAVMPSGGNTARSEAMAELSLHIHKLSCADKLGDLFDAVDTSKLETFERASFREMKRSWNLSTVLPADLVQAKSLAGSKCEHAWRTQRKHNDWEGFSKNFAEVVSLSRQEAQIRAEDSGLSAYDAMLDIYEPGVSSAQVETTFNDLMTWLPQLRAEVVEKQRSQSYLVPSERYSTAEQNALGLEVMKLLEFDFEHGRLDISSHPFCGGVPQDVRITTRYDEDDFVQSLMGIVHETGHARYEQGLPQGLAGLPAGEARSMGIHESQSLFFEMQLGRSPEFIELLSPLAIRHFSENNPAIFEPQNLKTIYSRVNPGLIRVDADELSYPAHVVLRFEIERDLINGVITYQDIPELWDSKMQSYLGLSTAGNYRDGCMQDIHWTDGSFGYFPSYTLGAMYAAQFMAAMKRDLDVVELIKAKDLSPIFTWLGSKIWSQASLLGTNDLVLSATGEALNPSYFQEHLKQRYLG
ncbi:carboxypeptidase M32 [Alginatibacterium sediminis]|uniref:Metal-dependent carboxypeptidase n=1 Tax=Alginatibacterium sediminis TaxID=2164068 RepID=A0A420EAP7_9ALTE|nr:carboxypeptidase M32 [Alginatibacterium sediminis]RKF17768.1 carboxypeptidase M32 [Alginatibacterium sediminis]